MKKQTFYAVFFLFFLSAVLISCRHNERKTPVIPKSKLPRVQLKIHRYGQALFSLPLKDFQKGLKRIKPEFLPFLNADLNDSAHVNQLYRYVTDTQILFLYHKSVKIFPQLNKEQQQLQSAFSYLKYYYPAYHLPKVYTYISNMDYAQPVMKNRDAVVIALDDYFGENFQLYIDLNIPQYHRRCMTKEDMVVDVMRAIYRNDFQPIYHPKTLLDNMLEAGKELYFLDVMLPDIPDSLKICYTGKQLQWMEKNKKEVWAVMVKNRFLYSTNYMLINKMTQPGPFSDGFSHASPPAMARWFGWQMARKYMSSHPKMTLQNFLKLKDAQTFLEESGYKP